MILIGCGTLRLLNCWRARHRQEICLFLTAGAGLASPPQAGLPDATSPPAAPGYDGPDAMDYNDGFIPDGGAADVADLEVEKCVQRPATGPSPWRLCLPALAADLRSALDCTTDPLL